MRKLALICCTALALALGATPARAVVTGTTTEVSYSGNGSTTVYPFAFKATDNSWVKVFLAGVAQSSGFTVTRNTNQDSSPGGSVTFTVAPASGVAVRLERTIPLTQELVLQDGNRFPAKSVEKTLDRLVLQSQQVDGRVAKAEATHSSFKVEQDARDDGQDARIGAEESARAAADSAVRSELAAGDVLDRAYTNSLLASIGAPEANAARVTVLEKHTTGWVNVTEAPFNATPDDGTDDTDEIQAALDAAAITFAEVWIPAGTFNVSGTLTIKHFNPVLRGAGEERTIIKQTNAALATPTLRTDPAITRLWSGVISDLAIIAPGGATNVALEVNNPNRRFIVERVRVTSNVGERSGGTGIHIYRTSGDALVDGYFTTIRNVYVDKHDGAGGGIFIEGQSPGYANLHWIDQTTVTDCATYGIHVKNTTSVRVKDSHIELNGVGVYGESSRDLRVTSGNYFERNTTYDVQVVSGDHPRIEGNVHNSSGYQGAGGRGIRIESGYAPEVVGNVFYEPFGEYDVELGAAVTGARIFDNVMKRRDLYGGWTSDVEPRILDAGASTQAANLSNPSGTWQYHWTKGTPRFDGAVLGAPSLTDPTLTRPVIARVNGSGTPPLLLSGDALPSGGAGTVAPAGSLYIRTVTPWALYSHGSATDTDWRQVHAFYPTVSQTYDPPSLAAAASTTTTVAVTGAAMGDFVSVSFSVNTQGVIFYGETTSAGTVTVRLYNPTAAPIDLGSGTLRVRVSQG